MQAQPLGVQRLLDKVLVQVAEIAPAEGRCLAFWHSPDYPKQRYCTLLFTTLWVLRACSAGGYEVWRVPGTVWRDHSGLQRILFSDQKLVRIRSGVRTNMVVLPERLGIGENAVPATTYRQLRYEQRSIALHERYIDRQFLLTLGEGLARGIPEDLTFLRSPEFYCRSRGVWRPRINGMAAMLLADHSGYNPDLPYMDNLRKLLPEFVRVEPEIEEGTLYPMSLIMGRGSVYVDLKRVYGLYNLPLAAMNNDEEVFKLELKERT